MRAPPPLTAGARIGAAGHQPKPKTKPPDPPDTSPAVTQLGATLPAQGCPFGLAGSGHAEVGSAAAVAVSEDELAGEEAALEQLDWGSIYR